MEAATIVADGTREEESVAILCSHRVRIRRLIATIRDRRRFPDRTAPHRLRPRPPLSQPRPLWPLRQFRRHQSPHPRRFSLFMTTALSPKTE